MNSEELRIRVATSSSLARLLKLTNPIVDFLRRGITI